LFFKDLIALPNFPGVSSASWGLNGFHEDYVLFSASKNSILDQQRVATMVAKEMAHYVSFLIICFNLILCFFEQFQY
jgi:aminopeptidase N